jgi:hypothetical protein
MSTKNTICFDNTYHIYQEMFDDQKVYLTIDKHDGLISVDNQKVTLSLSPEFLTKVAMKWIENRSKFYAYNEEESKVNIDWLLPSEEMKEDDSDN